MKNKKLFAAALTAALAVSMMGTSVMAATPTSSEGTTNFTYTPGTSGPIDPVDPGTEETSTNNWMVVYPRLITLTDSNVESGNSFTKGAAVNFTVKQKQAGADGQDTIKEENIPAGLIVEAEGAANDGTYTMTGTQGSAKMNLAAFNGNTLITDVVTEMGTLTHTQATQGGKAVIRDNSTVKDGVAYSTSVKFTFTNPGA